MSEQRPRRAAEDKSAWNSVVPPEPRQTPWQAPSTFVGGIKNALQARADTVLDWYAAQSKTLRVGLFGGVGAFCLMGVVAAASAALTPTPVTTWADVPSNPATSMSVRVSGSAGSVPSTPAPSATASSGAQLPSATETPAIPTATATGTGTSKSTTATTQRTTAAPTQTQPPGHTTAPTTAAPSPTTSEPTTAEPTTAPPTDPPTTDPPPTDPPTDPPTE